MLEQYVDAGASPGGSLQFSTSLLLPTFCKLLISCEAFKCNSSELQII
jgi:hypothetical protein